MSLGNGSGIALSRGWKFAGGHKTGDKSTGMKPCCGEEKERGLFLPSRSEFESVLNCQLSEHRQVT